MRCGTGGIYGEDTKQDLLLPIWKYPAGSKHDKIPKELRRRGVSQAGQSRTERRHDRFTPALPCCELCLLLDGRCQETVTQRICLILKD
jgi:hypothetical protein